MKEAWKGAAACPSVLPNSMLASKLASRFRREHTQLGTSQTTLPFIPTLLWVPLMLSFSSAGLSSKARKKSKPVNYSLYHQTVLYLPLKESCVRSSGGKGRLSIKN